MPHFHNQFRLSYFLRREINELYVMNAIRSFADSMISIFVPIFLLKQGFSLSYVLLFFASWSIGTVVLCYFAFKYISRKGVKHSVFLSIPFTILYFLTLYQFTYLQSIISARLLLVAVGLLYAVSVAYYWMGFHVEFAKFSSEKKSTKQLGMVSILSTVFSIFGPLVGALLITFFSFNLLFLIVIVLLIISATPLLFSKETHTPFKFNMKKDFFKDLKKGIPFVAEGFKNHSSNTYWPILLFVLAIPLSEIGGIYAISNTVLVLFTLYVSRVSTIANRHYFLRIGAYLHSLTLTVRVFLKSISSIAVAQGFGAISITMLNLPFQTIFYNNSKKQGFAYAIFFREIFLTVGRLLNLFVVFILLFFFTEITSLILGIIAGAIIMLFMTGIKEI